MYNVTLVIGFMILHVFIKAGKIVMVLRDVSYIVDLSNTESILAMHYLFHQIKSNLRYIVLHKQPSSDIENQRLNRIQELFDKAKLIMDIDTEIVEELPYYNKDNTLIFCGAPLTKVKQWIDKYQHNMYEPCYVRGLIVATEDKRKEDIQSVNLNNAIFVSDFDSSLVVFKAINQEIAHIHVYTETLTNNPDNTLKSWAWQDNDLVQTLAKKYNITDATPLKHTLAVRDGLSTYSSHLGLKRIVALNPDRCSKGNEPFLVSTVGNYRLAKVDPMVETRIKFDAKYLHKESANEPFKDYFTR